MAGAAPPLAPTAPPPRRGERLLTAAAERALAACVHCGFCLPACPTYRELGSEADAPRGRIFLVQALAEGRLAPADPDLQRHLDLCLDCRACETACPSGVRYRDVIAAAREVLRRQRPLPTLARLAYDGLLARPERLARAARLVAWAQRRGLTRGPWLRLLPRPLAALAPALPPLAGRPARQRLAERCGPADGPPAAAFLGCVQDAFFPEDGVAMTGVLAAGGHAVAVPRGQVCCGALHHHAGDVDGARTLARRNLAAFADTAGPVVVAAAGCGAMLKSYGELLPDDPAAAAFAARVRDFAEVALALPPPGRPVPIHATYHDPCHLAHGQGVRAAPRELLRRVPDLRLTELGEADACCGSAGVYNLTQFEMAMAVLDRKMANVAATGADVVVTANPGCALQLRLGVLRAGLRLQVRSLATVMAEAYGLVAAAAGAAAPAGDAG